MPPPVTRELSVVYGATTVGGITDRLLDVPFRIVKTYERTTVDFNFVTTTGTEAAFATEVVALEAAFRTPRQRLQVILGASSLLDLNPAANSGFNAFPQIEKVGGPEDTARSRRYRVSVDVVMPADLAGQSGRQTSSVELSFNAFRRRSFVVSGRYTALGGNTARAQYDAAIADYITSITGLFGGEWDLLEETATHDDTNKVCDFRRMYREQPDAQGDRLEATVEIGYTYNRRRTMTITGRYTGDTSGARTARQQYEAAIAAYVTTLTTKFTGTWELLEETATEDETDITLSFSRVYREEPLAVGVAGRWDSTVEVAYSPARRRTVTISGRYTDDTSGAPITARAKYEANIDAYATSVLGALVPGATFEIVSETATANDNNISLDFRRSYLEILQNQAVGTLNHPAVIDQRLMISVRRDAPGDSKIGAGLPQRFVAVDVTYSVSLDPVGLGATTLTSFWDTVSRPWVIQHAKDVSGIGNLAVIAERPNFDAGNRGIQAMMSLLGFGTSGLLSATVTIVDDISEGVTITPAWSKSNTAAYVFAAPKIIHKILRYMGQATDTGSVIRDAALNDAKKLVDGGGWKLLSSSVSRTPITIGRDTDTPLDVSRVEATYQLRWVDALVDEDVQAG